MRLTMLFTKKSSLLLASIVAILLFTACTDPATSDETATLDNDNHSLTTPTIDITPDIDAKNMAETFAWRENAAEFMERKLREQAVQREDFTIPAIK